MTKWYLEVATVWICIVFIVFGASCIALFRGRVYRALVYSLGRPQKIGMYQRIMCMFSGGTPANIHFNMELLAVLAINVLSFVFATVVVPYYFPYKEEPTPDDEEIEDFGDYKLVKVLDTGGMGLVFGAKNQINNKLYALKAIRKSAFLSTSNKKFKRQTIKYKVSNSDLELQVMNSLKDSQFVVKVIEAFQTQWHLIIIMPLYRTGSLWQQLVSHKKDGFTEDEVSHIASQLVHGLNALHSKAIVHNDVKPDNVMIQVDGSVQLTDFGNAQIGIPKGEPREFDSGGTPGYMSPEVLFCIPSTHAADFWSLGVTLYVLVHHGFPYPLCDIETFTTGTEQEIQEKIEDYLVVAEYPERKGVSDNFYEFLSGKNTYSNL